MSALLDDAKEFGEFLAHAVPVLVKWWNDRRDRALSVKLLELDSRLHGGFEEARARIEAKHAGDAPDGVPVPPPIAPVGREP